MSKTYDEWLKYYENATKEQVIEDFIEDIAFDNLEIERLNKELDKTRLSELHKEYVINELEKILNYDIDKSEEYMNKIRRSGLQQGDYSVHYYRAEWQKEKAIGYLDKLQELKGSDSNE